jgi:hypothetical protein
LVLRDLDFLDAFSNIFNSIEIPFYLISNSAGTSKSGDFMGGGSISSSSIRMKLAGATIGYNCSYLLNPLLFYSNFL